MTEARQKEQEPVRAQILEALAEKFRGMKTEDGYYYDYNRSEISQSDALDEFRGFQWGNAVMVFDLDESLETHLRTDLDEETFRLEILSIVRDEGGAERYKVVARAMSDIVKAFYEFRAAQNGVLIGPARITSRDWWDEGNETYGVSCSAEIIYQSVDGDAITVN